MIFSELYSAYYNTVAAIISRLLAGGADEKELQSIVAEKAFGESALTILPALRSGKWQLVREDMTATAEHTPTMPLTLLEKRWLKAVSQDARIKLFGAEFAGLEDVEPLFTAEDYCVYDKYGDGDDYSDEGYIARFRFLTEAIRERTPIKINITNRNGRKIHGKCLPIRLEYSEKDDKFRLITSGCSYISTVNLSRIISCSRYEGGQPLSEIPREVRYETVTLEITDERNERVMLHFAHFEKQAERIDENRCAVKIKYDKNDETEIVIRVLSFGPLVRVTESEHFIGLIKEKLREQKKLGLK